MRSYAAGRWKILWKLRVPAALPYIFSALKISATACIVGAIIGEAPSSIQEGLGGYIVNFNQYYTLSPQNLWATNIDRRRARHLVLPRDRARREARRAPRAGERRVSVVEIKDLTKRFERGDVIALQDIDLAIEPGEFVSLIGPSGCGKSTLLRIIGDLIKPTSGTVTVNGKPAPRARADHDYGMVFQDSVLFDWRTVAKNVALPLELLGWDRARRKDRVDEMLELVELEGFEDHHPWQLSGGMQMRVAIARALDVRAGAAADGRAVRRARRDDARADEHGAAADLGGEQEHGRLRDALDRRRPSSSRRAWSSCRRGRAGSRQSSTSTCRNRAPRRRARSRASSSS